MITPHLITLISPHLITPHLITLITPHLITLITPITSHLITLITSHLITMITTHTHISSDQQPDVLLMQSLIQLLPRFGLTTRLHVCQELLVLTRTNIRLGEQYSLLPSWYNAILCLMLG
jgi:hypothetical protein